MIQALLQLEENEKVFKATYCLLLQIGKEDPGMLFTMLGFVLQLSNNRCDISFNGKLPVGQKQIYIDFCQ